MPDSIWSATLKQFRDRMAGLDPVPAGVTAAAVSATLALALLSKVLLVTAKRRDFTGDPELIGTLLQETRNISQTLCKLADDDVAAFEDYLHCLRRKQPSEAAVRKTIAALRKTIEVPLDVARTAASGIALCEKASAHVHKVVAPDLGIAAGLLAGAVRSTLITVGSNLQQLAEDDPYRIEAAREASRLTL
jgi:formiminotetrahydrofolate cyclodeaminase